MRPLLFLECLAHVDLYSCREARAFPLTDEESDLLHGPIDPPCGRMSATAAVFWSIPA